MSETIQTVGAAGSGASGTLKNKFRNSLACTIFGGSVGSGDYGRIVGDSLQAFGAARCNGELDS